MPKSVEIDSRSGFCGGVIHAIQSAENYLRTHDSLFSLGDIVHNEAELGRLTDKGLVSIDYDDLDSIVDAQGKALLIRAHGEPPSTYNRLRAARFDVIDCTCPVVLNLQKMIRETFERTETSGGQILIFGKIGHAEVLGLVGQIGGRAHVVENISQLESKFASGELDGSRDIDIFSQTTMSPTDYEELCSFLLGRMRDGAELTVHNTICHQVATRHSQLQDFARNHDVIIFVAGKASSNGKVLSDLCREVNIRTFNVGGTMEISRQWFREDDRVGVCGATSTPKWLLEEVAAYVENLQ